MNGMDEGRTSAAPAAVRETAVPSFHILFVCTGNICRSALAERLTRSALGPGSSFTVTSAGTRAVPGRPMAERVRHELARLGGVADGFSSRPLTPELVAEADLVLAAASEHRAEAVAMHPPAAARAFTIAEFGALAQAVPPENVVCHRDPVRRAGALLAQVRALRGLVRVDQPDIADPYGGSRRAYRAAARRIAESLATPLRLLTHPPVS